MFITAAWIGITTVRNASSSSRKLSAITTMIWSGSLLEILAARSTFDAVVPPMSAVMSVPFSALGMTLARSVLTRSAV